MRLIAILFGFMFVLTLWSLLYAGIGWVVISAINLFITNPVNITFWSCLIVGFAIRLIQSAVTVTTKKD